MKLFKDLNYQEYLNKNPFHLSLGVKLDTYGSLEKKIVKEAYFSVNPENKIPFSEEMDDLIRLHYLVTSRKVTTILEFGIGKSTIMKAVPIQVLALIMH